MRVSGLLSYCSSCQSVEGRLGKPNPPAAGAQALAAAVVEKEAHAPPAWAVHPENLLVTGSGLASLQEDPVGTGPWRRRVGRPPGSGKRESGAGTLGPFDAPPQWGIGSKQQ